MSDDFTEKRSTFAKDHIAMRVSGAGGSGGPGFVDLTPIRVRLLRQGERLTAGDRNIEYGEPRDNFQNVALLWNAYLNGKYGGQIVDELNFQLTVEDVVHFCTLLKIGRTFIGKPKEDTYVDMAVYSAIAGELAMLTEQEKDKDES